MGLTIHWNLGLPARTRLETVAARLESLRDFAATLGLAEVSKMAIFEGDDCRYEKYRDEAHPDHDWFWFLIQASRNGPPARVVGFRTWPGEGCEEANFGLVQMPGPILQGWRWGSFCKTQYANDPECGGMAKFLRCHLSVVAILDKAKELKLLRSVSDEGEFWERRDVKALAREVGEWDEMLAAFVGRLKDQFGTAFTAAPILNRPDFEHLEAKGDTALRRAHHDEEGEHVAT